LTGSLVKEYSTAMFSISDVAAGIYLVVVKTDNGLFTKKFIKQ
jgi:hypothetical protein